MRARRETILLLLSVGVVLSLIKQADTLDVRRIHRALNLDGGRSVTLWVQRFADDAMIENQGVARYLIAVPPHDFPVSRSGK